MQRTEFTTNFDELETQLIGYDYTEILGGMCKWSIEPEFKEWGIKSLNIMVHYCEIRYINENGDEAKMIGNSDQVKTEIDINSDSVYPDSIDFYQGKFTVKF